MTKFSDLDLDAMKTRLDKQHADFMAEMRQKRIEHENKISLIRKDLDKILSELKQFDKETNNAFNKRNV